LNHELKIIVGFVELVPEEQIGLVRELNINKRLVDRNPASPGRIGILSISSAS
jgi:hypothetical protein